MLPSSQSHQAMPLSDFLLDMPNIFAGVYPGVFTLEKIASWLSDTRAVVLLHVLLADYELGRSLRPRTIAIIFLYTLESDIYRMMNRAFFLREEVNMQLWVPFTRQLQSALEELPDFNLPHNQFLSYIPTSQSRAVFRGLSHRVKADEYAEGKTVSLLGFSSSSSSPYIAHSFGKSGTIFILRTHKYKMISWYSNYPTEREFLISPAARFRCVKVYHTQAPTGLTPTPIDPMAYFYMACCEDHKEVAFKLGNGRDATYQDLGNTLDYLYSNPHRCFELLFGELTYSLVFLDEVDD
eukprot:NODE_1624_length_1109_cov_122.680189_g1326_i0.p1 GENE.NODE_1624_length_1109_cov_122.680189_g1326_i0~~NODE_1624_length_1109_cov_122.680189_g1326_i0.p1  ORF type:complete len:320 (-),score=69.54 NODE_1624_length_1109_cov_122.680189_g1326_i0:150-1034(-)